MAEMAATLPDGRKVKLKGPTEEAIIRKASEIGAVISETSTFFDAFAQNASERAVDGLLSLPDAISPVMPLARPAVDFMKQNTPTGRELLAGLETAMGGPEILSHPLSREGAFSKNLERRGDIDSENPAGAFAGTLATDLATLLALRKPFIKTGVGKKPEILKPVIQKHLDKFL